MSYNPSIGSPNRRAVNTYSSDRERDMPKNYAEAREAYERASKRRGGARGKVAHNTFIRAWDRPHDGATVYAIRLHDTDVVTFLPCGSIQLDTGGWQTPTTRDRMNRCGVRVSMGGGVPSVFHGGSELAYVDGMQLKFRSDDTPGMAWYPNTAQPCGTVDDIRARRRRVLARAQRAWKRGDTSHADPFYWPNRTGGEARGGCRGTVPEVFASDSACGLKPRDPASIAAQVAAISGVKS